MRRTIGLCMLEVHREQRCKLRSVSAEWPFSFDPSTELDERHPASHRQGGGENDGERGVGGWMDDCVLYPPRWKKCSDILLEHNQLYFSH